MARVSDDYWLDEHGGEVMCNDADGDPQELDEVTIVRLMNDARTELAEIDALFPGGGPSRAECVVAVQRDLAEEAAEHAYTKTFLRKSQDERRDARRELTEAREEIERLKRDKLALGGTIIGLEYERGELREEIERLRDAQYVCPECRHVFPWESLGVPCPHCVIERLRRQRDDLAEALRDEQLVHGSDCLHTEGQCPIQNLTADALASLEEK